MFYKLRDKERSNESAYVSHIARYAPFTTDKSTSLRNPAQLKF